MRLIKIGAEAGQYAQKDLVKTLKATSCNAKQQIHTEKTHLSLHFHGQFPPCD